MDLWDTSGSQDTEFDNSMEQNVLKVIPRLRRKRSMMEDKWGFRYYHSIKEAIFAMSDTPYAPSDPPSSVSEGKEEDKRFSCRQCRDSFYFQSSLKDHSSRRSWTLGYWCQHCFMVKCSHVPPGESPCVSCQVMNKSRKTYIYSKGLKKGHKLGRVRIFYNQCQFFSHLESHGIDAVDTDDIMLMPLPSNVEPKEYVEFEKACEAIMEQMFISNTHIMEWLNNNKLERKWWHVDTNTDLNNNPVAKIIKNYQPKDFPSIDKASSLKTVHKRRRRRVKRKFVETEIDDSSGSSLESHLVVDLDNSEELEDSSEDHNDIVFVDCGFSASTNYEPESTPEPKQKAIEVSIEEILAKNLRSDATLPSSFTDGSVSLSPIPSKRIAAQSPPKISVKKFAKEDQTSVKVGDEKVEEEMKTNEKSLVSKVGKYIAVNAVDKKASLFSFQASTQKVQSTLNSKIQTFIPFNAQNLHQSLRTINSKSVPKVLTIQGGKNFDLSSIIGKLPADVINSKKIVFIGQEAISNNNNNNNGNAVQDVAKGMIHIPASSQPKLLKTIPAKILSAVTTVDLKNTSTAGVMVQQVGNDTKFFYQNGRKYIIHPSGSSTQFASTASIKDLEEAHNTSLKSVKVTIPTSENSNARSLNLEEKKMASTSKPSEAKISRTQGELNQHLRINPFHRKPQSFHETFKIIKKDGTEYLQPATVLPNMSENLSVLIAKVRQDMLKNMYSLSENELKKRYDHLTSVNLSFMKMLKMPTWNTFIKNNTEFTNLFHEALRNPSGSAKEVDTEIEKFMSEWEKQVVVSQGKKLSCAVCNKILKPPSYIRGISETSRAGSGYCLCYNNVCPKCHLHFESVECFEKHWNYHNKREPFICPKCDTEFVTFKELEIHEWTSCFHTLFRCIYKCNICHFDGFLSLESLTNHFHLMHSENIFCCPTCKAVVSDYAKFQDHVKENHGDRRCYIQDILFKKCTVGNCVVRGKNYQEHMKNHLGTLKMHYYKCRFCPFSLKESPKDKEIIRDHLHKKHVQKLMRVMSTQAYTELFSKINDSDTEGVPAIIDARTIPQESFDSPKIIHTRTITPDVFEKGAESDITIGNVTISIKNKNAVQPENVPNTNPRSSTLTKFFDNKTVESIPKILDVRSLSDSSQVIDVRSECDKAEVHEINEGSKTPLPKVPKLVMILTKPVQNAKKNLNFDNKEQDLNFVSTPPPPPLSRIPQSLLKSSLEKPTLVIKKRIRQKKPKEMITISVNEPLYGMKKAVSFRCHICRELIDSSWQTLKKHFTLKHSNHYKVARLVPEIERLSPELLRNRDNGTREILRDKKRKVDMISPTSSSKRKRRWTPRKYELKQSSSPILGLCVEQESPQDNDGNYKCKKCQESCQSIVKLREHIASNHRIKGRYLICLECGENFVVAPSLQMHLKAYHAIEDPVEYMAQNTLYAPDHNPGDVEPEGKTTVANQCYVCMAVFEDKAAVDKHLRVHGMAFLNRKRIEALNAQKSPDKQNKSDQSPEKNDNCSMDVDKAEDRMSSMEDTSERSDVLVNNAEIRQDCIIETNKKVNEDNIKEGNFDLEKSAGSGENVSSC